MRVPGAGTTRPAPAGARLIRRGQLYHLVIAGIWAGYWVADSSFVYMPLT